MRFIVMAMKRIMLSKHFKIQSDKTDILKIYLLLTWPLPYLLKITVIQYEQLLKYLQINSTEFAVQI